LIVKTLSTSVHQKLPHTFDLDPPSFPKAVELNKKVSSSDGEFKCKLAVPPFGVVGGVDLMARHLRELLEKSESMNCQRIKHKCSSTHFNPGCQKLPIQDVQKSPAFCCQMIQRHHSVLRNLAKREPNARQPPPKISR
jgi:hypothetical protein